MVRIGGILDLSASDWPGKPCAVVFFAGCNFRCPFCQNSTLIPIDSGVEVDISLIAERLRKALLLVDSLHVTGGECTIQPDGLRQVCMAARELGMSVGVNTNGSRPDVLKALIEEGLVDHVAMDVKAPLNPEAYSRLTGVDGAWAVKRVEETIKLCRASGVKLEVRTTVVPGMIGEEEVASIASGIAECDYYILNQFVPSETVLNPDFRKLPATPREVLLKLARIVYDSGFREVYVRTRERGLEKFHPLS